MMRIGISGEKICCCKCGHMMGFSDGNIIEQCLCLSCFYEEDLINTKEE